MTLTLNRGSNRFACEVPVPGLVGDVSVAPSGQMVTGGPVKSILIAYTDVATVEVNKHLFPGELGRESAASGQPAIEIRGLRPPTTDDFLCWREEENLARVLTKEDRAKLYVPRFLNEVYRLSQVSDTDTAGYKIFDFLDRVLIDGFFVVCDDVLSQIDVDKLDTKLMRSFLSITAPAKKKLPSRAALYNKIQNKMIALRGEEKTRRIIGNLA
jgi:hypothetical protein